MDADGTGRQAFDGMEVIRDPSHVHALTSGEFEQLIGQSGLEDCRWTQYEVEIELESQIKASFPLPGGAERLRAMITDDIGIDHLGITPQRKNGKIWYTIPIGVYVGNKRMGS